MFRALFKQVSQLRNLAIFALQGKKLKGFGYLAATIDPASGEIRDILPGVEIEPGDIQQFQGRPMLWAGRPTQVFVTVPMDALLKLIPPNSPLLRSRS